MKKQFKRYAFLALSLAGIYAAILGFTFPIARFLVDKFKLPEIVVTRYAPALEEMMSKPWSAFIDNQTLIILLSFLTVFLLALVFFVLLHFLRKYIAAVVLFTAIIILCIRIYPDSLLLLENDEPSESIGSVAKGKMKNGKRIPFKGQNYETSSFWLYLFGRTHVHHQVRETVLESFRLAGWELPNQQFILGETSRKNGGNFFPHKTHRNGLSVDFMTPMIDADGQTVVPFSITNLCGYALHFDAQGASEIAQLDFEATATHILAVKEAAEKNGLRISKVIFAPDLQDDLFKSRDGSIIRQLNFSQNPVWVRHDNHYHIDFEVIQNLPPL